MCIACLRIWRKPETLVYVVFQVDHVLGPGLAWSRSFSTSVQNSRCKDCKWPSFQFTYCLLWAKKPKLLLRISGLCWQNLTLLSLNLKSEMISAPIQNLFTPHINCVVALQNKMFYFGARWLRCLRYIRLLLWCTRIMHSFVGLCFRICVSMVEIVVVGDCILEFIPYRRVDAFVSQSARAERRAVRANFRRRPNPMRATWVPRVE